MATYQDLPLPTSDRLAPGVIIRKATSDDIRAMTKCFFTSFTPSHRFWQANFPERYFASWWDEAWRLGIENDETARTYIAIDSHIESKEAGDLAVRDGRVIGFTRWIVPQQPPNLHRPWPELPEESNKDVLGPFFDGLDTNRQNIMADRPHWFLEMLGTDQSYQQTGVGYTFVQWGCELADKEDMEVYIDASMKGAPFYQKHFGAQPMASVDIPKRPETYGEYVYVSQLRPRQSERSGKTGTKSITTK